MTIEGFLSRWARLKRKSAAEPTNCAHAQPTDSEPAPLGSAAAAPVDVSSLPPVESISAESNVAAFLEAGVPEELTRAALRSAWASDPTIRDFVGIAENQWDFNSESAIAGFGSLSAEESARYMAARTLGAEQSEATGADKSESAKVPAVNASKDCVAVARTTNPPLPSQPFAQDRLVSPQVAISTAAIAPQSRNAHPTRRAHGSALPK